MCVYPVLHMWLAAPVAVETAIAVMHTAKALHPLGRVTALIAVIFGKEDYNE
ncbi:MAG: HPP family protein [Deltaproteobacteria bacterium]|jgi:CBS-domain-containing membrane protein|nr:HPP family protein [Deltaproteobacteria bacterium]MBW2238942.1 HPP family protein [Deltaproteobacteria bacterium]MBW2571972.1 HPP family protein [Deltaproteobacteria bacterium]MBW2668540.1 HPP family protein [Deltaproteobacteria bacterium]